MDYSHGDPEASCPKSRYSGNSARMRFTPNYTTKLQPLSESIEVTDAESEYPEQKPTRVSFKHSSTSIIEDLSRESETLLMNNPNDSNSNRPRKPSSALFKTLLDPNAFQGDATIFDLCTQDRQRVGQLIKELVESHDRSDDMEAKLHHAQKKERKYKQKCGDLMKKLDALDERNQKLENDKEKLKQGYLDKLTSLQHQISCISSKLEMSAQDLHALKEENKSLHTEVRSLQSDKSAMELKYKEVEQECRSTKSLLNTALEREIARPHLPKVDHHTDPNNSYEQGVTRIFPVRNLHPILKPGNESNNPDKGSQKKSIYSKFPSSSSMSSFMEDKKETKSEPTNTKVVLQRQDALKGLQDKEAAVLQDLFFIF